LSLYASQTPTRPDPPRAISRRFGDFDELSESFVDFDADYLQMGTGPVRAEVSRVQLDRVVVLRGDEESPQYVVNSTNGRGAATLLLLAVPSCDTFWLGSRAHERTVISYEPGAEHVGRSSGPMSWMTIHYAPAALERQQLALGLPVAPALTGSLTPGTEAVADLRRVAAEAIEVASDPSALEVPELRRSLEESILTAAVRVASSAPQRSAAWISRERAVRRAFEVLESRSREPLYLAELCEAAAVSERTLRNAFQHLYGVSPIRFLHMRRLALARRALLDADPARDRVSPIATRFGFTNLGRFAVEFRQLFGVSPSELLRGSRSDEA
jgi:AraC-like DNA-binding protein